MGWVGSEAIGLKSKGYLRGYPRIRAGLASEFLVQDEPDRPRTSALVEERALIRSESGKHRSILDI